VPWFLSFVTPLLIMAPIPLIRAGAVSFRPIVLMAVAVIMGSFVMVFDPIFQGLAIAVMFGALTLTVLTLIAVSLPYYEFFKNRPCPMEKEKKKYGRRCMTAQIVMMG
jgi:hypothetical protein